MSDRITQFERGIVFRVARGYFFVVAVVAVLVFVAGLAVGSRGLAKTKVDKPAPPPPVPAREPLTLAKVQDQIKREKELREALANRIGAVEDDEREAAGRGDAGPGRDPLLARLDALQGQIKELFPPPQYAWNNVIEKYCAAGSHFGCMRWSTRITKRGIVGTVTQALGRTSLAQRVELLEVLVALLKQAPVEQRGELIEPIVQAEKQARARQEAAENERRKKIAAQELEHLAAVAANDAKHSRWRTLGVYGLMFGFGLLIVVSLFLAFLAMERHLRLLERVAGRLGMSAAPASRPEGAGASGSMEAAGR